MNGMHRSVVSVMVNVPVGIVLYMHSKVEGEWDGNAREIFLVFLKIY